MMSSDGLRARGVIMLLSMVAMLALLVGCEATGDAAEGSSQSQAVQGQESTPEPSKDGLVADDTSADDSTADGASEGSVSAENAPAADTSASASADGASTDDTAGDGASANSVSADADPAAADVLRSYEAGLGIQRHEMGYAWQSRGHEYSPSLRFVIDASGGDGVVLGSHMADFDADGTSELLVVRMDAGVVTVQMYEAQAGEACLQDSVEATTGSSPIEGVGALDVFVDESRGIDVQGWRALPQMLAWRLDRYVYDGAKLAHVGTASEAGSDFTLKYLEKDLKAAGAPTAALEGAVPSEFMRTLLADKDPSVTLVTRLIAGQGGGPAVDRDSDLSNFYSNVFHGEGEQWSEPKPLGTFVCTQDAEVVDVGL